MPALRLPERLAPLAAPLAVVVAAAPRAVAVAEEVAQMKQHTPTRRPTRAEAIAMLEELYASLPELECKGRCHDTCTAIDASELERERMAERGVVLPPPIPHRQLDLLIKNGQTPRCPALSPLNTCRVYEVRPLICRAFGLVWDRATSPANEFEGPMMCDYGCVPDGTISAAELGRVLRDIEALSRLVTGVDRRPI